MFLTLNYGNEDVIAVILGKYVVIRRETFVFKGNQRIREFSGLVG